MGYFTDMYNQAKFSIEKAYDKNKDVIEGAASGAERESAAALAPIASKGGYLNDPMYAKLLIKNKAMFAGQKNQALTQLGAQHEQNMANMEIAGRNAALQDKQAEQQFWQNLIGGAGSIAGTALKIFGGPAGAATGAAADMASNIPKGMTNYVPDLVSKYKIPGME